MARTAVETFAANLQAARKRLSELARARQGQIARRYTSDGTFQAKGVALFNPGSISVTRYRYRGARIPDPWDIPPTADPSGLRAYRAAREEQRSLGRVQQALA